MKKILTLPVITFFILQFAFCILNYSISNAQWQQTNGPNGGQINCLVSSGSYLFAGTNNGVFISSDNGSTWTASNNGFTNYSVRSLTASGSTILAGTVQGIFLSTDNGANWLSAGLDSVSITSIIISGSNIFAGSFLDGIYLSQDNAQNWISMNNGVPEDYITINSFLISGSNILAGTEMGLLLSDNNGASWTEAGSPLIDEDINTLSGSGQDLFAGTQHGIFHSNDSGANWTQVYDGTIIFAIATDGTNIFAGTYYGGIIRSSDNGVTWALANGNLPEICYNAFVFNGSTVFAASAYCGIFQSIDNGSSWTTANNGILNTIAYTMATSSNYLFAGGSGGLYSTSDNGNNWEFINNNSFPNTIIRSLIAFGSSVLAGTQGSGIYLSTDLGTNWVQANNGLQTQIISALSCYGSNIFAGYENSVYISSNNAESWTRHIIDSTGGALINDLDASGTKVFAGADNGLYISSDNGINWTKANNSPTNIGCIAISGNRIFVGVGNGIYLSIDNGLTWNFIQISYITHMVNSLAISGSNIIAATNDGIYISTNDGLSWTDITSGLPSRRITSLVYDGTYLYGGVYEYGVWKRALSDFNISTYNFSGNVFNDINNNGTKDNGENGIPNVIVKTNADNWVFNTDSSGNYTAYSNVASDTISIVEPSLYCFTNPPYYAVTTSDTGKNFAVHYIPNVNDLSITLTNITPARPGFDDVIRITYTNKGTNTLSGYIDFDFDDSLAFISCNPLQSSINGNTITWNFLNLAPLESRNIDVTLHIPSYVPIGDELSFAATIYPVAGDTIPEDNYCSLEQIVTGSYDPNEKEVLPEAGIIPQQIADGEELVYTIHFQNTGTDTAFNIILIDTLSPNLNIASFEFIASSHPCIYNIHGAGIIEFTFANILLPDSNVNFTGSNGFVKYSVKAKSSLIVGDIITNTAYIYFDFNEAVATNTTSTIVKNPDGLFETPNDNSIFSIYPNPSDDNITISYNLSEKPMIEIYNIQGQCILRKSADNNNYTKINVSDFPSGLYFVKMTTAKRYAVTKFIKE
ncbi:MAG: T9SS type A sorting domain-containing protein [Bacteroidota bacterium]